MHSIVYNDMPTENNTMSTRIHTLKTHETWLQTNWILSINESIQVLILVLNILLSEKMLNIEILKYGICIPWLISCMNLNEYHTCSCNVYNSSICLSTACRRHRAIVDILCQHICCIRAGIDMLICRHVDEMLAIATCRHSNIMSTRIHTLNTHETWH